ncbi:Lrp/AsnC family transcriptional regulator [Nocardia sp. CA2R105]|uniref:Lrp/AsnC family transcriptional regulator n=1 Tax=Nocardia coffeae TaxID=2873381 RepID=UPI001CA639D0|nr:Lrp/AsnC family transcriptional regulator [Nocardia coffeae]MBY8861293.1 Lrp/AsnC family transcriptional regulator [Nocardia coffeae]
MDDLDRRVVNALQVNPRASWAQVGAVLGIDPVTASRRWQRLRDHGDVWITAYIAPPGERGPVALVEIDSAGHSLEIADRLADDPQCASIDIASGGRDLLLTVSAHDLPRLTDYLLHRLGNLDHVRAVRTHPVTRVIAEGADWRLTALTETEQARLRESAVPTDHTRRRELTDQERAVLDALVADGRASTTELAAATGLNPRRARDLVRDLLGSGRLTLRTELRAAASGWPIYAWFFLRVPAAAATAISPRLGALPEIRTVLQIAGPNNVIMAVWLRELTDVTGLEAAIETHLPDVEIIDRAVVLRTTKRAGVVLDPTGRRMRTVPMEA